MVRHYLIRIEIKIQFVSFVIYLLIIILVGNYLFEEKLKNSGKHFRIFKYYKMIILSLFPLTIQNGLNLDQLNFSLEYILLKIKIIYYILVMIDWPLTY